MRVNGFGLMITSLSILVLVGILTNNAANNGLLVPPATSCPTGQVLSDGSCFTCDQTGSDTCVLSAKVGCQVAAQNCELEGSTIAFLNACSPFTNILSGNYIGFINSFFSNCGQTPPQTTITPQQITVAGNTTFSTCSRQTGGSLGYIYAWTCSVATPSLVGIVTMPVTFTCGNWNFVFGNTTQHIVPTPATCGFFDSTSPTANTFGATCLLYGPPATPFNLGSLNNAVCYNFNNPAPAKYGVGQSLSNSSILGFALGLLGLAILVMLGLGIGVGAASVSVETNPQGSKLAQTFGIGLLIWGPLYSEFSTWFTSGFLPYGLDGVVGIVSIALIATYFFGLYAVSQTGSTGTSSN